MYPIKKLIEHITIPFSLRMKSRVKFVQLGKTIVDVNHYCIRDGFFKG